MRKEIFFNSSVKVLEMFDDAEKGVLEGNPMPPQENKKAHVIYYIIRTKTNEDPRSITKVG